jgi:hypothetical protein
MHASSTNKTIAITLSAPLLRTLERIGKRRKRSIKMHKKMAMATHPAARTMSRNTSGFGATWTVLGVGGTDGVVCNETADPSAGFTTTVTVVAGTSTGVGWGACGGVACGFAEGGTGPSSAFINLTARMESNTVTNSCNSRRTASGTCSQTDSEFCKGLVFKN